MTTAPDGLALPLDFAAGYGGGADRALVLGGGGTYFVAWQLAYLHGLTRCGVDLRDADIVVGTSAGSVVASIVASGRMRRANAELEVIGRIPKLVEVLAPAADLAPSQMRALEVCRAATDARPETVREVGRAALAAHAAPADGLARSIRLVTGVHKWPSPCLRITATDTYTGERVVITEKAGIPPARAAAASSSVPGLFSPQPIGDRKCMDGGMSGSGTHCDLVAGARRVLVLSLSGAVEGAQPAMTVSPETTHDEIDRLVRGGTLALARAPSGSVTLEELMSPAGVPKAIALAREQCGADAEEIASFWA